MVFGWSAYQVYRGRAADHSRELFVSTARKAAADITTIDYRHAESDVRRVLDSATGGFYADFSGRSSALIDVVKKTLSTSVGTVTEAGLESMGKGEASVLVTVAVATKNFGVAEQSPRYWRMRLGLVAAGDAAKVAKVDFVS